jgi:alkanesulfonate monooxygenase SsuD/methylene tetrahydromethanopterin reductase-like flavin-dependent oxidoreductase (luciferase family)
MRVWYFSEMAYHPAWEEGLKRGSLRVVLPNANYDPEIGHRLLNRYLDEFRLCDEVGLDIMVNEHHSTSTCLTISVPMALAVIARETKRARLLSLGNPIANRPDPVRVAEEMAWLDVLSGGRLEMGLVKGAPYEIAPANSNPANLMRRYWEAHDLILKAMSTTDGPFSWEGEFFHYRNVNIWPRPYQQPTPPVWMTGLSPETGRMAAERGHVVGTLLSLSAAGPMFDAYRKRAQELGLDRRARPLRLCRRGRRRHDARGGAAPRQSRGRLCSDFGGRGRGIHKPAGLQLARRQHRDAQIRRKARRLCSGPPRQPGRPEDRDDRAVARERYLLRRYAG